MKRKTRTCRQETRLRESSEKKMSPFFLVLHTRRADREKSFAVEFIFLAAVEKMNEREKKWNHWQSTNICRCFCHSVTIYVRSEISVTKRFSSIEFGQNWVSLSFHLRKTSHYWSSPSFYRVLSWIWHVIDEHARQNVVLVNILNSLWWNFFCE